MVNCIVIDNDVAAREAIENIIKQIKHINLIKSSDKLSDIKDILLNQRIDILFVDGMIHEKDGREFLDALQYRRPKIIVSSSVPFDAKDAFEIDAIDFILKPITVPQVVKAISKALNIEDVNKNEDESNSSIFLKTDHKFVKVNLKDVYLIEALADYCHVHTLSKKYTIYATMKSMELKLPKKDYVRVHKSYIVRIDNITQVEREKLIVQKKTIPIGKTYTKELMNRLKIL